MPTEKDLSDFEQFTDDIRISLENLTRIAKKFNVDISDSVKEVENALDDIEDIREDEMDDAELEEEGDAEDD